MNNILVLNGWTIPFSSILADRCQSSSEGDISLFYVQLYLVSGQFVSGYVKSFEVIDELHKYYEERMKREEKKE